MRGIEIDLDLRDRARGLMVGIAAGNLLGLPYEFGGWDRKSIAMAHPNGIREIDAERGHPDDDDLAQSILLAEASIAADALDIDDLAHRFWNWGEVNGAGMGGLTNHALSLFGGHRPRRDLRNYVKHQLSPSGEPPRQPNGCAAIDTDTNGAIAGAVLGARFGLSGIPARWRDKITTIRDYRASVPGWGKRERLESLADRILQSSGQLAQK